MRLWPQGLLTVAWLAFGGEAAWAAANYEPYTFTHFAGSLGGPGYSDGTGSGARFSGPGGVAADSAGNVYVADSGNHTIRKITPGGVVTTLAGLTGVSGSDDGAGSAARFNRPFGVAVDSPGNVYVADELNHTIRKITPGGVVTTLAGLAGSPGSADGAGSDARFGGSFNFGPKGVAVDASGNVYVADTYNYTIRKITPSGVVTTLAGLAGVGGSADGTGSAARFEGSWGVAVDASGNVYAVDADSIRKITPGGVVTTLAGGNQGSNDGTGSAAQFFWPSGVAVDSSGNVFVADSYNNTIRKITPDGGVTTLAGRAGSSGSTDGDGSAARFGSKFGGPDGVAVDPSGNVYVADTGNSAIRKITPGGAVMTFAGLPGLSGSDDGTGSAARFSTPGGVAVDSWNNVYVADYGNHTIRKITPGGVATTLAGLAGAVGSADGTAITARFKNPGGVAVDSVGNVYVADSGNNTIRKVTSGGVVSTLAGLAGHPGNWDGTGSDARFSDPNSIAVDSVGNVYVVEWGNSTIRRITLDGVVTTLAGLAGAVGSEDGTGSVARFYHPIGVTVDASGNVYVGDTWNSAIRKGVPPPRVFIAPDGSGLGYVNVTVPKGWSLIANPLYENTVSAVLKPPEGSILFALGTNGWSVNAYAFGAWADPSQKLAPGEGVFFQSPAAVTLTFSGQIPQGIFTNHVPAGLSLKAAIVPQGGRLDTDLGFPVAEGDIVYRYVENRGYVIHSYLFGGWDVVPVLQPGEAFFVRKLKPADWVQEFHLNP